MSDRKSEKQKKESESEILEKVTVQRTLLSEKAEEIRECPNCTEGWHGHLHHDYMKRDYLFAKRCHCYHEWQKVYDELMFEFAKLTKDTRDGYKNLVTEDMLDWHSIPIPDEEIVTPERQKEILRKAAMLGNKFAQWKTGMEEERERW